MNQYPVKPKGPALGQHFLTDLTVIDRMIVAADVQKTDNVFEIGPGAGILTIPLTAKAKRILAIEKDQALLPTLQKLQKDHQNLHVVLGDLLTVNVPEILRQEFADEPYKVVANIPYYISGKFLQLFWGGHTKRPEVMVVMLQREVAKTLAAKPGEYTVLSLSVQIYAVVELLFVVPRTKFQPPPKVDSAVVCITQRKKPLVSASLEKKFFHLITIAFSQRRKTLVNSLAAGLHLEKPTVEALLSDAGVPKMARAQELSIQQWLVLLEKLEVAQVI